MIVVGGQAPKAIRSVECYDFEEERWDQVAELPSRRCRAGNRNFSCNLLRFPSPGLAGCPQLSLQPSPAPPLQAAHTFAIPPALSLHTRILLTRAGARLSGGVAPAGLPSVAAASPS